jgi:hypothetical protein
MNEELEALKERLAKEVLDGESCPTSAASEYADVLGVSFDALTYAEDALGFDSYDAAIDLIEERCEMDCGMLFEWIEERCADECQPSSTETPEGGRR